MNYMLFRLQLGMIVIGLGITVWGGHMTIVGMSNMSPTQMKYSEYCKQGGSSEWLILDECYIDYRFSCAIDQVDEKTKKVRSTEYYVAVLPNSEDDQIDAVKVFMVVDDPGKKKVIEEYWKVPEAQEDTWFEHNQSRCVEENVQIKGLARSGLDLDEEDRSLIKKMVPVTDANFQILERNKEPQGLLGFIALLAGIGIAGGGGVWLFTAAKGKKRQQLPYPPGPGGAPRPGMPGRPGAPRPAMRPGSGRQPGVVAPPPPAAPMPGLVQQAPPPSSGRRVAAPPP
ncbi:MAG: hypothetical protein KDB82_12905, partial [Planctomycetes bacterium]|nr:hypothetical protein [Planctomycetota bacterium]